MWQGQVRWEGPQPILTFGQQKDQEAQGAGGGGVEPGKGVQSPTWAAAAGLAEWAACKPPPPSSVGRDVRPCSRQCVGTAVELSGPPRPPTPSTQPRPGSPGPSYQILLKRGSPRQGQQLWAICFPALVWGPTKECSSRRGQRLSQVAGHSHKASSSTSCPFG